MDISLRPVIKDRIFETQLVSHHRLNPTTEGRWGRNPMRRCARISNEAFGPHPPHQVRREIQNTNSPPPMVRGWRFFVAAAAAANRHRRRRHYPGYYPPDLVRRPIRRVASFRRVHSPVSRSVSVSRRGRRAAVSICAPGDQLPRFPLTPRR